MDRSRDILTVRAVVCSWIASAAALPATILLAVVGQGVASVMSGCRWIGVSTPLDDQVWALVNQPNLAFAAESRALGYWLGSTTALLVVALLIVPFMPRPQTLPAELLTIQLAWFAALFGLGWIPLLDLGDGHVARWLVLRRLPEWLVWLAPAAGTLAALVPSLRLLALLAGTRRAAGRITRLGSVTLHLVLPLATWVGLLSLIHGRLMLVPTFALLFAPLIVLALAWIGLPRPHVFPLAPVTLLGLTRLLGCAALLAALVTVAGRPLPDGRRSGLLWSRPSETNNIRPWIDPVRILDARRATGEAPPPSP